ncbi:MAG: 2-oxoacid:acceptor oxidoreductase family protein [Dehalococcoidia bacterium]|nr:2-oxoacid:acceptor oxidoreductase family protein [Dehalococcoidia bacterium]
MSDIKQVLLCGLGGQGVVLAGALLGAAAFREGFQVSGTSSYGSAARGGECRSEVLLSRDAIAFPYVTRADILVAFSQPAYNRYLSWTACPDGVVFYDDAGVQPEPTAQQRHIAVSASRVGETSLGTTIGANIIMLAAVATAAGLVSREKLTDAVLEGSPSRFRELNARALELGFSLGTEITW